LTATLTQREMKHGQMLDTMEIEQERGITIKLQPVRMKWKGVTFNLIDTPGHVDFAYEVSRSLAACEGAILLVDATQGIEAQTLANVYMALEHDLDIIPVINKIDLPNAEPERRAKEMCDMIGFDMDEVIYVSGKTGINVESLLDRVVEKVSAPKITVDVPTRALVFDSFYDAYRGVIAYVRVMDGSIEKNSKIRLLGTEVNTEALEVGYFSPSFVPSKSLESGEIGYIVTGAKDLKAVQVGDTVTKIATNKNKSCDITGIVALDGYHKMEPFVFAGIFCADAGDYGTLRSSLEKLVLSDSSLQFEPESSDALGFGFRCGFLGLLHMEIIQERLEREFDLDLVFTSPTVQYKIKKADGEETMISNPSLLPDRSHVHEIGEPWVKLECITPKEYVGDVMKLCEGRRGIFKNMQYIDTTRALISYEMPMANIITNFYDRLKGATKGYASFSYETLDYRPANLIRLDFLIADEMVESLSMIVIKDEARSIGVKVLEKLKEIVPRQMFKIALQACISGKVIARENISAYRKNVTAGLYGGDISRKKKLLQKQAKGKKRMQSVGKVQLPKNAFLSVLKID
jgi:GTP-binding protein LepA